MGPPPDTQGPFSLDPSTGTIAQWIAMARQAAHLSSSFIVRDPSGSILAGGAEPKP
jgi:hypothetical protein